MEIAIGVSGNKGSSRQQIHSLKVLKALRSKRRFTAQVCGRRFSRRVAGSWDVDTKENREHRAMLPVQPGSDCLCELSLPLSITTSGRCPASGFLCMSRILASRRAGERETYGI